jgi:hypothetical protein
MAVYSCARCGRLISLSIILGGNPATKMGEDLWAGAWRQCLDCKRLWCDACTKDSQGCPDCAGALWIPDAEGRMALMFPEPRRVQPAPDANSRTWIGDLRSAMDGGLPVLAGVPVHDGVPDLRDGDTAQKYLRWLCVLCWVTKADGVTGRRISVTIDDRAKHIDVSVGNVGVVLGGTDPYGPRAMNMTGRWADPADADLIALALRCAWEDYGVAMQPYVAKELEELAAVEAGQ